MHITKNVCESLFGTPLNMPEKTKDGPKSRNDLKFMGIRRELHPLVMTMMRRRRKRIRKRKTFANEKGRPRRRPVLITAPPACFTLCEEEIKRFIHCLIGV